MKADQETRDSFVLYKSFYAPIAGLTDEQLGRLFRAVFQWQITGEADRDPDEVVNMALAFITNQFRIDNEKYLERCEMNRANANIRWGKGKNAIASNRIQSHPNECDPMQTMPNDNENGNDKGNEKVDRGIDGLILPFSGHREFVDTWNELLQSPKWRHKTTRALRMALTILGKHEPEYAVFLMRQTIAGDYQGIPADPMKYTRWKRANAQRPNNPGKVITNLNELYKD